MTSDVCFGINEHCVSPLVAMKCTHAHTLSWPLIKLLPAGQTELSDCGFIISKDLLPVYNCVCVSQLVNSVFFVCARAHWTTAVASSRVFSKMSWP